MMKFYVKQQDEETKDLPPPVTLISINITFNCGKKKLKFKNTL